MSAAGKLATDDADIRVTLSALERRVVLVVGWCMLPISKPSLKARLVSALETRM